MLVAVWAAGVLTAVGLAPRFGWGVVGVVALVLAGGAFLAARWLRLQRRIKAVAREWQLTIDAVEDAILTLDPNDRILRMNRAAMELSGRSYHENLGCSLSELGAGEPWLTASQRLIGVQAGAEMSATPVEDPETGESWEISVSTVRNPVRNRPTTIVVVRNVTELVDLKDNLHRQELISAMGSLVAGVAHDMRNFVLAINGTAQILEKRFEEVLEVQPGEQPEHRLAESRVKLGKVFRLLPLLREQGNQMNALMQTLLDFGKPIELTRSSASIVDLIREACRICASSAEAKGVEVVIRENGDIPLLAVDRTRVLQAFKNLIENAVQHTPEGEQVSIEAIRRRRWIECRIRDVGPGFEEADLRHLFEPFFTRREGGTGFGLAITRRVVEEHGGEIEATNHPEGGALFRVRWPLDLSAESSA